MQQAVGHGPMQHRQSCMKRECKCSPCRASEAAPEKWTHVQRKQLGKRGRTPGNWRDAAAAASLAGSPQSTSHGSSHSSTASLLTARTSTSSASQPTPADLPSSTDASIQGRLVQKGLISPASADACNFSADVTLSVPLDGSQTISCKQPHQQQQQQQQQLHIAGSLQRSPRPQDSGFRSRLLGFLAQTIGFGPAIKH